MIETKTLRTAVLGAAGQLGREVVAALVRRSYAVRAIVRRAPVPEFEDSVDVRVADARETGLLREVLSGCDAVVNAIGAGTLRRNNIESSATGIAIPVAEQIGARRYIAISAGMVALDWDLRHIW